jgi:hypothetical protein
VVQVRNRVSVTAIVVILATIGAWAVQKEDEKSAVLAIVQQFFDTMTSRDVEGATRVLMPEARMISVRDQIGQPAARASSAESYLKGLGEGKQTNRERMWQPEVRMHGGIASVWTPYDFWVDGKFSHCGIDIFDLVKTAEGWKIAAVTYTVERTGCAPSPLGPLK